MKYLVAYFSASGITADVAKKISKHFTNSDLYEIKPEIPYSDDDLDWRNKNSRSSIEMKNKSSRPKIIKDDININDYDKILIGFPIWWYTAPTIINSFLEAYDFTNKEIILWATSGGSGLGTSKEDLSKSTKGNIKLGHVINSDNALKEFIKSIK